MSNYFIREIVAYNIKYYTNSCDKIIRVRDVQKSRSVKRANSMSAVYPANSCL